MNENHKRKILHISYDIHPGGGPHGYLYNLRQGYHELCQSGFRSLVELDFDSIISSDERLNSSPPTTPSKWKNIIKNSIPCDFYDRLLVRKWDKNFKNWRLGGQKLFHKIHNSDIVVIHSPQLAYLLKELIDRNKTVYYMQHSPTPWCDEVLLSLKMTYPKQHNFIHLTRFLETIERSLFEMSDKVIIPSEHAVDAYSVRYPGLFDNLKKKGKVIYLPSGVPEPQMSRDIEANPSGLTVAFVGRYHPHKGFDIFLEVIKLAYQSKLHHIKFFSLGSGPITPNVSFPNYQDFGWQKEPHQLMKNADVIIVPNRATYFDLLPLEAMALGKIVIVSPVGGNIDLAEYSSGIILAQDNNPESYLNILNELSRDKERLDRLSQNNFLVYKNHFSMEKFAKRHLEIIK
jgi:Glycosyltransferase